MGDLDWIILLVHNLYLGAHARPRLVVRSTICRLIRDLHLLPREKRAAIERGSDLIRR